MLTRILAGPLFGAALASGWWAWALWGDGQLMIDPGGGFAGFPLVAATAVYGLCCLIAAVVDMCAAYDARHTEKTGKKPDDHEVVIP